MVDLKLRNCSRPTIEHPGLLRGKRGVAFSPPVSNSHTRVCGFLLTTFNMLNQLRSSFALLLAFEGLSASLSLANGLLCLTESRFSVNRSFCQIFQNCIKAEKNAAKKLPLVPLS